jgi:hypothetical protein
VTEKQTKERPPPKRKDALKIELEFDDAISAALATPPPPETRRQPRKKDPSASTEGP